LTVFTFQLLAIRAVFCETCQVAFLDLLLMNNGRDDFSETWGTEGGADIVRPPGDLGVFFPFLAAFHALYTQSIHPLLCLFSKLFHGGIRAYSNITLFLPIGIFTKNQVFSDNGRYNKKVY